MTGLDTLELMAEITSARGKDELLARMKAAARDLGYDQVLFAIQMRLPTMEPIQHINSGYPLEYQLLYQERGFVGADPTVAHCQVSAEPLVWEEQIYNRSPASREVLEEAQRFGLGHGLSVPVHESGRVISMLSLGRDRPFESPAERRRVIAAGKVLANVVHVASENHILPDLLDARRPHLSPRERQCFQLVALGKSNWDIGVMLNISEATVAFHVQNVLKKLKVSTRNQAVAIGVALGIIT